VKTELLLQKPFEYNTANLIAALSFYGAREQCRGMTLVTAPVSHSAFNVAVVDAPASDDADLLFRVHEASEHFRALGRGWNLYACEDMLDSRTARRLDLLLDEMGMARILDAPGMEADELEAPLRKLPELQYEPVSTARARLAFTGLVSTAFHVPYETAKALYLATATPMQMHAHEAWDLLCLLGLAMRRYGFPTAPNPRMLSDLAQH